MSSLPMTVLYGYCLQAIRDRCSSCFMLWPWIVAILQDHTISVQTHLMYVCLSMLKSFCVCCHLFFCTQDPWSWTVAILQDSMPSVITHRLHICLSTVRSFWAGCRPFFWIMAILQDSMHSVITHLLHTFINSLFVGSMAAGPCFPCMQASMASPRCWPNTYTIIVSRRLRSYSCACLGYLLGETKV